MNTEADAPSCDGPGPHSNQYGPYEPSVLSSIPSSQVSVFSDASSASSSIATSISDDFRSSQDDYPERCTQRDRHEDSTLGEEAAGLTKQHLSYANVTSVPAPQLHNPRRSSLCRAQKPPPLVRQRDRKVNFVDNLVDSATQMVEVIWPLSVVPCRSEVVGRGVLPLRTYIEETLKRSKTSYSTLQVALYYLVLIRPHVPQTDFTMEQTVDCPAERSLMCGRRMFLAALILASKYLQDRNYSAKAWSKMSGLKVCEINANERKFLSKINWKLHMPKPAFEKWQAIVLKYSPNTAPPSPGHGVLCDGSRWKRLIPLLTAELDSLPMMEEEEEEEEKLLLDKFDIASSTTPTPTRDMLKLPRMMMESTSHETTPTPTPTPARPLPCLEPIPNFVPPMPALARLGPLPTPVMTPHASSTPAVSAAGVSAYGSRPLSMCSAMDVVQKTSHNRCIMDGDFAAHNHPPVHQRRLSSVSTTSSAMAPRACLARQATCRNAGLLHRPIEEEHVGSAVKPIVIDDDVEMVSSPLQADFSLGEKALHAPHRHSRGPKQPHSSHAVAASAAEKSKKRGRTQGHRRSQLQEEVRYLLEESLEDDSMDLDDRVSPPAAAAAAAEYASSMLSRGPVLVSCREVPPAATISGSWEYARVPVHKNDGKKRSCCSVRHTSISPVPLYGQVS